MHVHAPAHVTYAIPGRLLALVYTAGVVVLVFASVAVLAARSHVFASDAMTRTIAPSAVRSLQVGAYELQVGSLPRRIGEQSAVAVGLLQFGRAVSGASVRITFTMPAMPAMPGMRGLSTRLREKTPGTYGAAAPILTVGSWRVSVQVTPRDGKSFRAGFTYRVSG